MFFGNVISPKPRDIAQTVAKVQRPVGRGKRCLFKKENAPSTHGVTFHLCVRAHKELLGEFDFLELPINLPFFFLFSQSFSLSPSLFSRHAAQEIKNNRITFTASK